MGNAWRHFCTITYHKLLVMRECFRLGLYRQGVLHDLSKYSWTEFRIGAKYYQGTRSPNNAEREAIGYSSAWLHHKGRKSGLVGMKMPEKYVVEMFVDRIAACKVYKKDEYTNRSALEYYESGSGYEKMMHPETQKLLETLLVMLAEQGEEATYLYIRENVLKKGMH